MKKQYLHLLVIFFVTLMFSSVSFAQSVSRTDWEMNRGSSWSWLSTTLSAHGEWPEVYENASIPAESDPNWGPAPDGEIIGFSETSSIPSYANHPTDGYTSTCARTADYTYFQTFVTVPPNTDVTTFTIDFSGMDDGSRITIFNGNHSTGIVDPGSYVTLGGSGTADLASYVTEGVNRIVVTQVDDCPTGNNLQSAVVTLNGETVQVGCTPEEQTFTILGANGSVGDIDPYSQSLPAGETEWQPVYLTGGHPWGLIPGTNSWVNFDSDDEVGLNTRTPYRIRFEVPEDYTDPSMVFQLKADNRALIWINDTFIDSVDGAGNITPPDAVVESALHTGLNEIRLMMVDWGGIVGFNYRVDVTMTSCEDITDAVLTPDEAADLNNAPTADAGPDQNSQTASVTLDGSGSSDPDGNLLTYSWTDGNGDEIATGENPTINLADGSYTITLTVSDGELTDTGQVVVIVSSNQPPVANAGADQSYDCVSGSKSITLDGSASSDPDGDALSYSWNYDGNEVSTDASFSTSLGGGSHTFTLTVSDGEASSSDDVTVTVELDETAPELTVPDNITVSNDEGECNAVVEFDVSTSDNCENVTVEADPASGSTFLLGETEVSVTATDDAGNATTKTFTVTVEDNEAPEPTIPDDMTVSNDPGECSAVVTFDVSATDNCENGVTVESDPASGSTFELGETEVTVTATDAAGNEATETFTVTVEDTEAPTLVANADPITLWPPNHSYHSFEVSDFVVEVADNCADLDVSSVVIDYVTSDEEEDARGGGDGRTSDDISFDGSTLNLRAERQGGGNGRVYTVYLSVADGNGNASSATCQVIVPHSKKSGAVDDGTAYQVSPSASAFAKSSSGNNQGALEAFIPDSYRLEQNYPNPFNPTTTINYGLPEAGHVNLTVYNIKGSLVTELVSGYQRAGMHAVNFDASHLATGTYIYVLEVNGKRYMDKMTLMK